ncbi:hypothetical protein MTR_7g076460 [Medicago truncatula]|uniref:Uncharacterized protein n=1 Tax=Medicago truncatula TaxID=3880 RepID=G7L2I7_MEDTR|nr:hypothetical protein MTR_7g076460 [Medicago truncatula]
MVYDSIEWEVALQKNGIFDNLMQLDYGMCDISNNLSLSSWKSQYQFKLGRGLHQGLNVMLNASARAAIFTGYGVSADSDFQVSHLQFSNVTLLLAEKSWSKIRSLRANLILFEIIFGLKVNFHKSMLDVAVHEVGWLEAGIEHRLAYGYLVKGVYKWLPSESASSSANYRHIME